MIKNVLLIYPPARLNSKALFGLPPLGLLYISAYLNQHEVKTYVFDGEIQRFSYQDLRNIIVEKNIDLIGFNVMTVFLNTVIQLSARLKDEFNDIPVVLGGPHISGTKEEMLEYDRNIDYLIYGEGEEALLNLIQKLNNNMPLMEVPNLIYRSNKDIIMNKPQKFIVDLDLLPFPELSHIINYRPKLYNVPYSLAQTASIITSRGCPYNCIYCYKAMVTRNYRSRTLDNLQEEFDLLAKYKVKTIYFGDECFTLVEKRTNELLELLSNYNFKWGCQTRPEKLGDLQRMKKAGCVMVDFGVETFSDKILRNINKQFTADQARRSIKLLKQAGMPFRLDMILGLPGETKETINESVTNYVNAKSLSAGVFPLATVYPKTELWEIAKREGKIKGDSWHELGKISGTVGNKFTKKQIYNVHNDIIARTTDYKNLIKYSNKLQLLKGAVRKPGLALKILFRMVTKK